MLISKLQTLEPKDWAGMTTENHLGYLYQQQPQLVSDIIELLYKVNLGGEDFVSFINKFPKMYIDDDVPYEWLLQGSDEKNVPLITYWDSTGAAKPAKPGIGKSIFYMEFPERWFSATNVIVGNKEELYKLLIVNEPTANGATWLYPVQLNTGDDNLFVPIAELAAGTRWSLDYSLAPQTLSKRGGDMTHTSPFRMQNVMSSIRKQYLVPGNMIRKGKNKPLAFSWIDPYTKKKMTSWLAQLDWQFKTQFRREIARLLIYGGSNKNPDGTYGNISSDSGYEIRTGFGLYDQIAPSNTFFFNHFDIDWLGQVSLGLSVGKLPEDERRFVLSTGEYGAYDFHVAASNNSVKYTPNFTEDRIYMKGDGRMGYRGQFMEYQFVNGIKYEIMIDPLKDDPVRHKILHPDGGLAASHSFDIWDFGTADGESNIQRVAIDGDEEIYRYIPGLRDPFTPYNNLTNPAATVTGVDGYEVLKMFIGGIRVKNPMRCGRLIPNILA